MTKTMTENALRQTGIGRVVTRFGADLLVEAESAGFAAPFRCTTRRKLDQVACGDRVQWERQAQGNAAVTGILPRKNVLERPDFRGKARPIAANIDLLVVVSCWRPSPAWEMLDRYLIAARRLPAEALIVMNKADLRARHASAEDEACLAELAKIGYTVLHVAANARQGIGDILTAIQGKTAIVVGQSGVGKSSIANQLLPEAEIRVGEISDNGEGRHTTVSTTLYHLPGGGTLIDSPGVRDFGLTDLKAIDLQVGFPEFQPYLGECRFNNCTHNHEPGCAVKAALAAGELPPRRYQRYLNLLRSL